MLQYQATVRLGGKQNHAVTGKIVTIPEIAILRHLHGGDAVDITGKGEEIARSDAEERDRLRKRYDNPTPDATPLVDQLFGGPLGRLPTRLSQIGVDVQAQAAHLAAQAQAMAAAAANLTEGAAETDVDELFPDDETEEA